LSSGAYFLSSGSEKSKNELIYQHLVKHIYLSSGFSSLSYLAKQWKEFGDPRYELTMAALHKNQKVLTGFL